MGNAFIIARDDGSQESYPLRSTPTKGDRFGSSYWGEFRGFEGTYYDLPLGFPTTNEAAAQCLSDPSIPSSMKRLIQENFPLKATTQSLAYAQH